MTRRDPRLRDVGPRVYLRIRWVRFLRAVMDFPVEPLWIFALLLVTSTAGVAALSFWNDLYRQPGLWDNILVEAHGMLFDILILGILFSLIEKVGRRKRTRRHYQNEIRDFADWPSEEATRRIVGNIKRLNAIGVSDIDLRDCILTGSKLGPYSVDDRSGKAHVDLRSASLHRADFRDADLRGADLRDANLYRTRLDRAVLDRADLRGAVNLSVKGLLQTASLAGARLDPDLLERLRAKNPNRGTEPRTD